MCRNPSWHYAISIGAPSTSAKLSADKCCCGSSCSGCRHSCVTSAWGCASEPAQRDSFMLACAAHGELGHHLSAVLFPILFMPHQTPTAESALSWTPKMKWNLSLKWFPSAVEECALYSFVLKRWEWTSGFPRCKKSNCSGEFFCLLWPGLINNTAHRGQGQAKPDSTLWISPFWLDCYGQEQGKIFLLN